MTEALLEDLRIHTGFQFREVEPTEEIDPQVLFDLIGREFQRAGQPEIVAMEQQLIKDGLPAEKLQRLSDLHVEIFREALEEEEVPDAPPGHPVHTFMEENELLSTVAGDMDLLLQQLRLDSTPEKLRELSRPIEEALDRRQGNPSAG